MATFTRTYGSEVTRSAWVARESSTMAPGRSGATVIRLVISEPRPLPTPSSLGPVERVPRYRFGVVVADTRERHIKGINFCAEQAQPRGESTRWP
jgi:hypothetical protein